MNHPHSDIIDRMVRVWNELRERKTPSVQKIELVGDIYKMAKGRIVDLAMRHDTSRAIQGCIKYGSPDQRVLFCAEALGKCLEFTKSKHGHQLVEKMLLYGNSDTRRKIANEFRGHMVRLMTHNLGSLVVNTGFTRAWNHTTVWNLYQELYGPEYIHFKEQPNGQKNLGGILVTRPDKRKIILESMFFTLSRQAEKGLLSLAVSQRLLAEYLQYAPPEHIVAMLHSIRDQILSLVATREGARAACLAFHYGTAKERKLMLRGLKGHMLDVACHVHGHMVLIAAMEVTDDTRTSGGAIFSELSDHIPYLACHRYGKRILLALLAPLSKRYFSVYDLDLLKPVTLPSYIVKRKDKSDDTDAPTTTTATATTGKTGKSNTNDETTEETKPKANTPIVLPVAPTPEQRADAEAMALVRTSRKDDTLRRSELLQQIRTQLETACLTHTAVLARSMHGAMVLLEACCVLPNLQSSSMNTSTNAKNKKDTTATTITNDAANITDRIYNAVADLVLNEPSSEEIGEAVDAMNQAAATASAGSKSSGKLLEESGPTVAPIDGTANTTSTVLTSQKTEEKKGSKPVKFMDDDDEEEEIDEENEDMDKEDEDDDDEEIDEGDGDEDNDDDDDDDDVPIPARDGGDDKEDKEEEEEDNEWYGEEMLPILEHSPSHLLFKRLLQREAVPRISNHPSASKKNNNIDDTNGTTTVSPIFGPILYSKIQGHLSELATSNRAAFVIVELLSSTDTRTTTNAKNELRKNLSELQMRTKSAGIDILIKLLSPTDTTTPVKSNTTTSTASTSLTSNSGSTGGGKSSSKKK